MKKHVIRFHQHAWVDIVVEADNDEEAMEIAFEKYNNGCYDDSDTDFENTYTEDVTGHYDDNCINY